MTPDALTADALYYLPDISGIAVLRYLRCSHPDDPQRWFFWNIGRGQSKSLTEIELAFLCSDLKEAKKQQAKLLRTQLKAHAKRRYRGRNRAAGRRETEAGHAGKSATKQGAE